MKETFELVIAPDGSVEGIYQDGLAETLSAEQAQVCRASNVEWEYDAEAAVGGWTVRSAKQPEVAIRVNTAESEDGGEVSLIVSSDEKHPIFYFKNREQALEEEVRLFWDIMKARASRLLVCPRCETEFKDPDPQQDFPHGIICPECSRTNKGGLVGVIHPE